MPPIIKSCKKSGGLLKKCQSHKGPKNKKKWDYFRLKETKETKTLNAIMD